MDTASESDKSPSRHTNCNYCNILLYILVCVIYSVRKLDVN